MRNGDALNSLVMLGLHHSNAASGWHKADSSTCLEIPSETESLRFSEAVPAEVPQKRVRIGQVRVEAGRHHLRAIRDDDTVDDIISVKQMDYGEINHIFVDRSGNIIAIGDQTSYRVGVRDVSGKAEFNKAEPLPTLFSRPCGLIAQLFGSCQIAKATVSRELGMAFLSGYSRFGHERSLAIGGEETTNLEWNKGRLLYYVSDLRETGYALLSSEDRALYIFDGTAPQSVCPEQNGKSQH